MKDFFYLFFISNMLKSWNNCASWNICASPRSFWWQLAVFVFSHICVHLHCLPFCLPARTFSSLVETRPHCVAQAGTELNGPPVSVFRMLGLQACDPHTWLRILSVCSRSTLQILAYLTPGWLHLRATGVCLLFTVIFSGKNIHRVACPHLRSSKVILVGFHLNHFEIGFW